MTEPTDTEVKVAELRELLAKATPGPWEIFDGCSWRRIGNRDDDCAVLYPYNAKDGHPDLASRGANTHANLKLIVAAVNSLPELLDALDEARLATRSQVADVAAPLKATHDMQHAALLASRMHEPPLLPACKELWAADLIWSAMIATLSPQGATDANERVSRASDEQAGKHDENLRLSRIAGNLKPLG
jgi:hypothetical protein